MHLLILFLAMPASQTQHLVGGRGGKNQNLGNNFDWLLHGIKFFGLHALSPFFSKAVLSEVLSLSAKDIDLENVGNQTLSG